VEVRTFAFFPLVAALSLFVASPLAGCGGGDNTTSSSSSTSSASGGLGGNGAGGAGTGGVASGGGGGTAAGLPTSGISVIIEPDGQNGAQLVAAIQNATKSVHMTMYILSDNNVIDALIHQQQIGHEVKVVLDQAMPSGGSSNQPAFDQLQSAGVQVVWAPPQFTYTHEKAVIIDGTTAWIMTMNAAYSSPHDNREYLAIDTLPDHVTEADAVFQGDFAGSPLTTVSGPLVVAPIDAHALLDGLVSMTTKSLDIEAEELSDDDLVNRIVAVKNAGATVRIVRSDQSPSQAEQDAINRVKAVGCQIVELHQPYVHAKLIVVDNLYAYVGSANFTYYSLEANRELGVLFAVQSEITKIEATFAQDIANGTPL
jgi:phosphatidylserine/phosphatidylglycerophosphate/cardiolipin synthase-like enzyme